jgi:hypothetical protein
MKKGSLKKLVSGAVLSAALLSMGFAQEASADSDPSPYTFAFKYNDQVKATGIDVKVTSSSAYKTISYFDNRISYYNSYVLATTDYRRSSGIFRHIPAYVGKAQHLPNDVDETYGPGGTNTAIRATYPANKIGTISGAWAPDSGEFRRGHRVNGTVVN